MESVRSENSSPHLGCQGFGLKSKEVRKNLDVDTFQILVFSRQHLPNSNQGPWLKFGKILLWPKKRPLEATRLLHLKLLPNLFTKAILQPTFFKRHVEALEKHKGKNGDAKITAKDGFCMQKFLGSE